jgi:hypothetical protein
MLWLTHHTIVQCGHCYSSSMYTRERVRVSVPTRVQGIMLYMAAVSWISSIVNYNDGGNCKYSCSLLNPNPDRTVQTT